MTRVQWIRWSIFTVACLMIGVALANLGMPWGLVPAVPVCIGYLLWWWADARDTREFRRELDKFMSERVE